MFPKRTTLSCLFHTPPISSGACQFLLWKKQGTAVPHPSLFHQTPLRHPDPGRRAQVFPGYCISKSPILRPRWGISPPQGTSAALASSTSPQPPPWVPAIPHPGGAPTPCKEDREVLGVQLGGVERLNPACRRVLCCSARQLPEETSRDPKCPSHRRAVHREWLGQSPQRKGRRAPPSPSFAPTPTP